MDQVSRLALVALLLLLGACDRVFGLERPPPVPPVPGEWKLVASGGLHTCAIQTDGSLWCWGENFIGEVGLGTDAPVQVLAPTRIGDAAWATVTGGVAHTCGIRDDGTLWCWGYNGSGAVGDGTGTNRGDPTPVGSDHWLTVAAGDYHVCAIRDDRSLWCWGQNLGAQLGDGTLGERAAPVLIDAGHAWAAVAAGSVHTCAITKDGQLWCWGSDASGAIGAGNTISMVPKRIEAASVWSSIAAGNRFTCGTTEGSVRCWGANDVGQLGDGTRLAHADAAPITSPRTDWTSVITHSTTVCAIAGDGALECWGENRQGEIGSDTAAPVQTMPHPIDLPTSTWKSVALGALHSCAIDDASHLWCTGAAGSGQLGDGTGGSQLVPARVDGAWTTVGAGAVSTCGLRDGKLWCWGDNAAGELGEGTTISRQVPTQTMMDKPSPLLTVGPAQACDIDTDGSVYCWGDNRKHQLAAASDFVVAPARVALVVVNRGVSTHDHTCVIGYDTYAYCVGRNDQGQLGRGVASPVETVLLPVPSGPATYYRWTTIRTGDAHTCGILDSGVVYCWGRNAEGQIGDTTVQTAIVPTPVRPVVTPTKLDVGGAHTCAIEAGTLRCWGANTSGQLGDGTLTNRSTPTLIGAATWKAISTGSAHTCGIQADDSLWCWGPNTRGELGTGSFSARSTPTRVGTASWLAVSAGRSFTCGIQVDSSLWCWGDRLYGQLGDNRSWVNRFVEIGQP